MSSDLGVGRSEQRLTRPREEILGGSDRFLGLERTGLTRALSVPIESERRLYFFILTGFLHANRYPLRIKSGAGFRWKTL